MVDAHRFCAVVQSGIRLAEVGSCDGAERLLHGPHLEKSHQIAINPAACEGVRVGVVLALHRSAGQKLLQHTAAACFAVCLHMCEPRTREGDRGQKEELY